MITHIACHEKQGEPGKQGDSLFRSCGDTGTLRQQVNRQRFYYLTRRHF
jgi:hypothetical protein